MEVPTKVPWEPTGSYNHPSANHGGPAEMQYADWVRPGSVAVSRVFVLPEPNELE